ncbi:MAG TPA: DNA-3-methyladenine glycosylase [Polyangiaceae bacterium]|jgi:DNA-3-methyladenine glycosylase
MTKGPAPAVTLEALKATTLPRDFYLRDARVLARALLGTHLVHAPDKGEARAVRIVETEAYCGPQDLACHARAGLTKRTRTLLGPPGHAYVFLIYGMYDCFNVTCRGEGKGHAVLVRGGEPVLGIAHGVRCDGPGKLARALGITRAQDGADLTQGTLFLAARVRRPRVMVTARVGVAYAGEWADRPWRFLDTESKHASRPAKRFIGRGVAGS